MKKMIWLALVVAWGPWGAQAGTPEENKTLIESLKKEYPLETCVVSGERLGEMGAPIEYLHTQKVEGKEETRLVRFCCKGCIKSFKKGPALYLKQLDEAKKRNKP